MRSLLRLTLLIAAIACLGASSFSEGLEVVERTPSALAVRLEKGEPGTLYRVIYDDGKRRFVWENTSPGESGEIRLQDDKHLRPEYRLQCESRTSPLDPVIFDDELKAPISGTRRLLFGVPVSTFGGAGYLVPGVSCLRRDDFGNTWLYLDHSPYAILKYNAAFEYQFALLTPEGVLAHDLDAKGNLYVLHPGNWVSKHGPLGESLAAWELPFGREEGEFVSASGMAICRDGGSIYLADEILGRVQRFNLDLELRPLPQVPWGWIGREALPYERPGEYDPDRMYYQLDRPRQLVVDGREQLYVASEHYLSKFDLATGRQIPFGRQPVLGWGGTFTDSPFSSSAALDGHWQRYWLAGVDADGNIYICDRDNEFVVDPRLQIFSSEGELLRSLDLDDEMAAVDGRRVYLGPVSGLTFVGNTVWLADAGGRIYQGPAGGGLQSGGRLFLGPGAAGRQVDIGRFEESKFAVEAQTQRVRHQGKGMVVAFPDGSEGSGNCEREGRPVLGDQESSMWVPVRLGEPFRLTLLDADGKEIPSGDYRLELEEKPGLFGTRYDYFRVTNTSGRTWRDVRFVAETVD